ncbi:MAG: hypothetical protein NVS1B6_13390 [Steroidobacteraceae bacterium]
MEDLSNWDFAVDFTARDAAALMLGFEPPQTSTELGAIRPVIERMKDSYGSAHFYHENTLNPKDEEIEPTLPIDRLESKAMLSRLNAPEGSYGIEFYYWLIDDLASHFDRQLFTRKELARWLCAIDMKSVYNFDRDKIKAANDISDAYIDPADLPHELSVANISFRAVVKGYGDGPLTFKNKLIAYLKKNYPDLSTEAVKRIATVANPAKAPGRRKSSGECPRY